MSFSTPNAPENVFLDPQMCGECDFIANFAAITHRHTSATNLDTMTYEPSELIINADGSAFHLH